MTLTQLSIDCLGIIACEKVIGYLEKAFPHFFIDLKALHGILKKAFLEPPQIRLSYHFSKNDIFEGFHSKYHDWRVVRP